MDWDNDYPARRDDDMIRPSEVARMLGFQVDTVKRAIPPTDLPFVRVNSRGDRRYLVADVRRYLAARRVDRG